MLKETCESYSVVGEIWLLSKNSDGVFLCCGIVLEQLFSVKVSDHVSLYLVSVESTYMKAIPTMPSPTTTRRFCVSLMLGGLN